MVVQISGYRTEPGYHGDQVWEHKRGKIWRLVEKLERENRYLRHESKVLRIRLRSALADPPVTHTRPSKRDLQTPQMRAPEQEAS